MKNYFPRLSFLFCLALTVFSCTPKEKIYNLSEFGIKPDTKEDMSALFEKAVNTIKEKNKNSKCTVVISLDSGRYEFYPENSAKKEYFISNHDQDNPKSMGVAIEDFNNLVFNGNGSDFIFHGRMLPISIVRSNNVTLKNLSIDFENPHISQVKVLENDTLNNCLTIEIAPWVKYEIRNNALVCKGLGWEHTPGMAIAFEGDTKRLVYNTSDVYVNMKDVEEISPRVIKAKSNSNKKLIPGTVLALRGWGRPTPGIFMTHDKDTRLENIKIHYSEGMGLLAQVSENITLDGFSVCLRGENDPRYFTSQADATHFSGCKGKIVSENGLYEGMMDDAINVHGTYLKVIERKNDTTLVAAYMHPQAYGFDWGFKGDKVQFIDSKVMEVIGNENFISQINPYDKETAHGAKQYIITFKNPIDTLVSERGKYGIENLEWTPEVAFSGNTIRNNRARGSLFSTPKKTVVENNIFDHTSGTAILLCGDCNGWYETGACHDVIIRNNVFDNSLTNMFQFTNAIISIYPEIPDLKSQKKYFHGGKPGAITIENNVFRTFDIPVLYAKSVNGLVFKNNKIVKDMDYPAFHWNNKMFWMQNVENFQLENNTFENVDFDEANDVKIDNYINNN
ncbi:MAG: alpha-1,3-galactosidase B [Bacteroidales bacterium]|nr:alpha-1,3-galactosidase B [Bacteroidales bacterium]